jgi:hypothetical protein
MPLPRSKIRIKLHQNQKELSKTIAGITGNATDAPAFYWQKTKTIHLQTEKLSIGILAHEMAHAVVDDFFVIQPPPKIKELLSQFVDREISTENSLVCILPAEVSSY